MFFCLAIRHLVMAMSHVLLLRGAPISPPPPCISMYIVLQRNCSKKKDIVHRLGALRMYKENQTNKALAVKCRKPEDDNGMWLTSVYRCLNITPGLVRMEHACVRESYPSLCLVVAGASFGFFLLFWGALHYGQVLVQISHAIVVLKSRIFYGSGFRTFN
jgi:hypothetical protein